MSAKPFIVQNLHASYSMPQVLLNSYYKRVYSFRRYHWFSWRYGRHAKVKDVGGTEGDNEEQDVNVTVSLLAQAGCILRVSDDTPSSLPTDPHKFDRHIDHLFSAEDPSIVSRFFSGFSSYIQIPQNFRRESIARVLLLVAPIQSQILNLLLEKLPEHFNADAACVGRSLKDDIARLIMNQLRSLDFLVDSGSFAEKLMEVLSISPPGLKKDLIGSLPEIIGDKCHSTVVSVLEKMLLEDSNVIVPVLDSFTALNLDEQLLEQD